MIKALHHTKIAMNYFEDVSKQVTGSKKHLVQSFANKCDWILKEVTTRLPRETSKKLNYELEDSLFMDAIENEVIKFNKEQRDILENIILLISKGEKIEMIDNTK